MTFRQDSLLFCQSETFYIMMVILCMALLPMIGVGLTLICALPFVVLALANPRIHNAFVTIDDFGISCNKAGELIWEYEWDHIADLRRSNRFMLPSIEVIAYSSYGKPEQYSLHNHYFQLGRKARIAIEKHYNQTNNPRNN